MTEEASGNIIPPEVTNPILNPTQNVDNNQQPTTNPNQETGMVFVRSVEELRLKNKKVYREMTRAIAERIIREMKKAQTRFKKALRG